MCRRPIVRESEENYCKHSNEQIINKQGENCIETALKFYCKFNLLSNNFNSALKTKFVKIVPKDDFKSAKISHNGDGEYHLFHSRKISNR